jgi:hypothetical protein
MSHLRHLVLIKPAVAANAVASPANWAPATWATSRGKSAPASTFRTGQASFAIGCMVVKGKMHSWLSGGLIEQFAFVSDACSGEQEPE